MLLVLLAYGFLLAVPDVNVKCYNITASNVAVRTPIFLKGFPPSPVFCRSVFFFPVPGGGLMVASGVILEAIPTFPRRVLYGVLT